MCRVLSSSLYFEGCVLGGVYSGGSNNSGVCVFVCLFVCVYILNIYILLSMMNVSFMLESREMCQIAREEDPDT